MKNCRPNLIVSLASILVMCAYATSAHATRVNVRVVMPNGEQAGPGVSVTIADNAGFSKTGITANQGRVRFPDVPEGNKTITVERDGARGEWQGGVRGRNQNVSVTLIETVGTLPPAIAPDAEPSDDTTGSTLEAPRAVAMQIDGDAECTARSNGEVTLMPVVHGPAPSEYRASESSFFADTTWRPYVPNPRFQLSAGSGRKRVHYQVRSPVDGTLLESNVYIGSIERVVSNARATLAINDGAGTTVGRSVTLNNAASFDGGGANPRYIASESPDFGGAQWQSYSTAPQFTLSEAIGTKTVYFIAARDLCGIVVATEIVSDTITLESDTLSVEGTVNVLAPIGETQTAEPPPAPEYTEFTFRYGGTTDHSGFVATSAELILFAESHGFAHDERRIAGEGQCSRKFAFQDFRRNPVLWLTASPEYIVRHRDAFTGNPTGILVKSLICEFSIIGGRPLNEGWSGAWDVELQHPFGAGKWLGTIGIVSPRVVRINVPAYQCGEGTLEICPQGALGIGDPFSDPFLAQYFGGSWVHGGVVALFSLRGPSDDWRDAFRR